MAAVVSAIPMTAPPGLVAVIRTRISATAVPSAMITPTGAPTLRILAGRPAWNGWGTCGCDGTGGLCTMSRLVCPATVSAWLLLGAEGPLVQVGFRYLPDRRRSPRRQADGYVMGFWDRPFDPAVLLVNEWLERYGTAGRDDPRQRG